MKQKNTIGNVYLITNVNTLTPFLWSEKKYLQVNLGMSELGFFMWVYKKKTPHATQYSSVLISY